MLRDAIALHGDVVWEGEHMLQEGDSWPGRQCFAERNFLFLESLRHRLQVPSLSSDQEGAERLMLLRKNSLVPHFGHACVHACVCMSVCVCMYMYVGGRVMSYTGTRSRILSLEDVLPPLLSMEVFEKDGIRVSLRVQLNSLAEPSDSGLFCWRRLLITDLWFIFPPWLLCSIAFSTKML